MKSFAAITLAFLAATISATPTARDVACTTVQFTNDKSGAYADVEVAIGVGAMSVKDLLSGTSLDKYPNYLATSFFLQSNFHDVICKLNVDGSVITVNEQSNYAEIGYPPVNLVAATIRCNWAK